VISLVLHNFLSSKFNQRKGKVFFKDLGEYRADEVVADSFGNGPIWLKKRPAMPIGILISLFKHERKVFVNISKRDGERR